MGEWAIDLNTAVNASLTADIRGNDVDGNGLSILDGFAISINDGVTATVNIVDNTLTDIGDDTGDEAIRVNVGNTSTANSTVDLTVNNNSITNNAGTGLLVDVYGNSDADLTINNNTFSNNGGSGVNVVTTISGTEACLAATGNSFTSDDFVLDETADGSLLRVPGVASELALETANSSVNVISNGGIGYIETCTIP